MIVFNNFIKKMSNKKKFLWNEQGWKEIGFFSVVCCEEIGAVNYV